MPPRLPSADSPRMTITVSSATYQTLERVAADRGVPLDEAARLMMVESVKCGDKTSNDYADNAERRRTPRKRVSYPAVVNATSRGGTAFSKGFVRDFSLGGMLVQLSDVDEEKKRIFSQADKMEVAFTSHETSDLVCLTCDTRRFADHDQPLLAGEVMPLGNPWLPRLERMLAD